MTIAQATIFDVKNFWNRRPCNVNHGTSPVGTRQWSNEVTAKKYMVEPHILSFAQFKTWAGKRVLEVGCGIGTDTIQFIRNGALVDAIDVSEESIRLAQSRADFYQHDCGVAVKFHCMSAEDPGPMFSLGVDQFDLVYSFGVLHHTPNPKKALQVIYNLLKPQGELRIMVYAKWSWKNLLRTQWEAQAGCPIVHTYTERSIRKLLADGFDIVSIEKTHIFPWKVSEYIHHNFKLTWYFGWVFQYPRVFRWLERQLGHHLLVVARRK